MAQNRNAQSGQTQFQKRSGATTKIAQKGAGAGKRVTYGWKLSQGVMYSYFAGLVNKKGIGSNEKTSKSGNTWKGCVVEVLNRRTGEVTKIGGAMIIDSPHPNKIGKVIFRGFVMNPWADNGGYIGPVGGKGRSKSVSRNS